MKLTRRVQQVLSRTGLNLERRLSVPFGARWVDDLAALSRPSVMLDVGANVGQTAIELMEKFPTAHVWSFEPVPNTYLKLAKLASATPRLTAIQTAIGARSGRVRISDGAESGRNSVIGADLVQDSVSVDIDTIDSFFEREKFTRVDLLKIDVEGYELEVLEGAKECLSNGLVSFILLECDFVHRPDEPHGDFFDIWNVLQPHGFRVVAFYADGIDGYGWRWGNVLLMLPRPEHKLLISPYQNL